MRLIDADAMTADLLTVDPQFETMIHWSLTVLDAQPTVDAVEVVRCKDCKHYQLSDDRAFGFPVKRCEITGFEDVDDDCFCSWAERRQT